MWYDSSYICAPYQRYHITSFERSLKFIDQPHRFGLIDFSDEVCIFDSCCAFIEAQFIIPGCNYGIMVSSLVLPLTHLLNECPFATSVHCLITTMIAHLTREGLV